MCSIILTPGTPRKLPGVFEQSPVAILLGVFTNRNKFFFPQWHFDYIPYPELTNT